MLNQKKRLLSGLVVGTLCMFQLNAPVVSGKEIQPVVNEVPDVEIDSPISKENVDQNNEDILPEDIDTSIQKLTVEHITEPSEEESQPVVTPEEKDETSQKPTEEKEETKPPLTEGKQEIPERPEVEKLPIIQDEEGLQKEEGLVGGVEEPLVPEELLELEELLITAPVPRQYDYWDWDNEVLTDIDNERLNKVGMVWDDESIYVFIEEKDIMGNTGSFTWGTYLQITSNQGISRSIRCYLDGSVEGIPGGKAVKHQMDQAYYWEIKIPLSCLGSEVYEISLNWDSDQSPIISGVTDLQGKHEKPELPPIDNSGEIKIDGEFDDWTFIPKQEITYQGYNGTCDHWGRIYVDDEKVYGYFKMNEQYGRQMVLYSMYLKVNGREVRFDGLIKNANNTPNWGVNMDRLPVGLTRNIGIFADGGYYLGDAILCVHDSNHINGDEYEFCISKDRLSQFTGIPVESMTEFTLRAPNIGDKELTALGTPTGAIGGIACSLAMVGAALFQRKKQKENTNE